MPLDTLRDTPHRCHICDEALADHAEWKRHIYVRHGAGDGDPTGPCFGNGADRLICGGLLHTVVRA